MMKKFNSLSQLREEKKRIKREQSNAEKRIQSQWEDLKNSFKPSVLTKDIISYVTHQKSDSGLESDSVFKNTLVYGVTLLVKKLADNIEHRIARRTKS